MELIEALRKEKIQIYNEDLSRDLVFTITDETYLIRNVCIRDNEIKIDGSSFYKTKDLGKALNVLVYGIDIVRNRTLESKIKEELNKLKELKGSDDVSNMILDARVKLLEKLLEETNYKKG